MKKRLFLVFSLLCLSGCGSTYQLEIQTLEVSWTLDLKVQMQAVVSEGGTYAYQEVSDQKDQIFDSLLISKQQTQFGLSSYVQQELNRLRMQGYEISQEHTKKSKKLIASQEYPALLKTYRIVNPVGVRLFMAQYAVQKGDNLILLSYASDQESHRKSFITSLNSLTF